MWVMIQPWTFTSSVTKCEQVICERIKAHPPSPMCYDGQCLLWLIPLLLGFQVRFLEQQNKVLQTKWQILQQQSQSQGPKQNLDGAFESFMNNLRNQIEAIRSRKAQLASELQNMQQYVEDFKNK